VKRHREAGIGRSELSGQKGSGQYSENEKGTTHRKIGGWMGEGSGVRAVRKTSKKTAGGGVVARPSGKENRGRR